MPPSNRSSIREQALAALDECSVAGSAPDPRPDGFKRGELITMSVTRPSDAVVRAIPSMYMPWLGKSFDASTQSGVNILKPNAKKPMGVLWRGYTPSA